MKSTLLAYLLLLVMKYVKTLELSDFKVVDGLGDPWSFSELKHVPVSACCLLDTFRAMTGGDGRSRCYGVASPFSRGCTDVVCRELVKHDGSMATASANRLWS